jgi:putative ABC transport system ATP-binding protein
VSAILTMGGVCKTYGSGQAAVDALREVTVTVDAGELVAVMGPSGSGKSSLLTIAGTLERATSGEVCVDGQRIADLPPAATAALRRRSIGFVFQDYNLLAGLTAAENVAMPMELDGTPARVARVAALDALSRLDLTDRADHYPDDLSGGERQRVAIARAVVGDRRLVLADEPTGALDTLNGEVVMRLLREVCRGGAAGVVVTHDAQLAAWADRIVFLRDGRVVDHTAPAPLVESLLAAGPAAP